MEKAGSTTTHYGYNRAGERCWTGSSAGTDAQKLSRACATGPSGSTAYVRDADGNNQGLSSTAVTYNNRNQVANIDGLAQDYLDQGNDLRTSTAGTRVINGPLGVTAYKTGSQTVFLSRDPAGTLMTYRPTTGTSLYYLIEPNGNVAGATDPFGYLAVAYEYSPYGEDDHSRAGRLQPVPIPVVVAGGHQQWEPRSLQAGSTRERRDSHRFISFSRAIGVRSDLNDLI